MRKRKQRVLWVGSLLSVLACGLACAICVMSDPLTRLRQYQEQAALDYANRLDNVLGEVEPVFLAEDQRSFPNLSPDGKWMAVTELERLDMWMMDMESYRLYNLGDVVGGTWFWLDDSHYFTSREIVRVPDLSIWPVESLSLRENPEALAHFVGIERVLAVEGAVTGAYVVVSTDPKYPYTVDVRADNETELATRLGNIPYTIVPESVWRPSMSHSNMRVYSPDGKYFVSGGEYSEEEDTYHPQRKWAGDYGGNGMTHPSSIIFDAQTEEVSAMALKDGWGTYVLGWAPDSSGVYLQFIPLRSGYSPPPAGFPTYKLLVPGQKPSGKKPIVVEGTPLPKP
jgi:hypothetical protein